MKRPWFLCKTKSQQESYAADNCKQLGFKPFLPKFFCDERQRVVPLFPTYLFVQTDGRWYILESTWGIIKVIRWSDKPEQISNKIIAALRRRADRKGIIRIPQKQYTQGQEIRVKEGPFAEWTGMFDKHSDKSRVQVLLNILGRRTAVTLEARGIEPVAA